MEDQKKWQEDAEKYYNEVWPQHPQNQLLNHIPSTLTQSIGPYDSQAEANKESKSLMMWVISIDYLFSGHGGPGWYIWVSQ